MNKIPASHYSQLSPRSGVSLMELLIVISTSAVLFSLIGVWTFKLLQFSVSVRQRHSDHVSLDRLATDFRRDVRLAQAMKLVDDHQLELQTTDGSILFYRLLNHQNGCAIQVQQKNEDQMLRQEEYRLSDRYWLSWDRSEMPGWISLIVNRRSNINIPAQWSDGKISPSAKPSAKVVTDESIGGYDSAAIPVESIGPIEMQIRVGPKTWEKWELIHEP